MRPIVVQAGPLVTASASNIATSQSPAAAGWLALNGTLGTAVANNIAASQSISGASAISLNGVLASFIVQTQTKGAILTVPGTSATSDKVFFSPARIYITSAGNDSSITFTVIGLTANGTGLTEVITGANAGVAVSANLYASIISITTSASTASTVTVGCFRSATLDKPRRVLITTGSAISFTITGTNWAGDTISETVTNSGSSVASVLDYATVTSISNSAAGTTITVGTNTVGSSPWARLDDFGFGPAGLQCVVSGTVNYTVQVSYDDPNSLLNPISPSATTWSASSDPNVVAATATALSSFVSAPPWVRAVLNSGSGSVIMTVLQNVNPPYNA